MRIITGRAKGLKLKTPQGMNTRPTSDRVKESLFSILSGMIDFGECENVLDIFAGTGALGLETISRGAKSAVFVDNFTADLIRENVRRAKFETSCEIICGDVGKILPKLSRRGKTFELIFCDPPYKKNLSQMSLKIISEMNLLKIGGLLIIETACGEILVETENLKCIREVNYGKTTSVKIFERGVS